MTKGAFWSIGEVLSLLQDEFPEITISKIRFLESQGLIQPERTPSGYRRFYQGDFDLLQWILVQQRDHYLPLKVIRDRIEAGDLDPDVLRSVEARSAERFPVAQAAPAVEPSSRPVVESSHQTGDEAARPEPTQAEPRQAEPGQAEAWRLETPSSDAGASEPGASEPGASAQDQPAPAGVESEPSDPAPKNPVSDLAREPGPPLALTREELADSSGCSPKMVADLERYRLVKGRKAGPTVLYDHTALLIARMAAQFDAFGLEPRHLRTFLIGAEREVELVYQVVEPMLHRRDEETRRKAHETLDDLTDLAGSLRSVLMRQAAEELLPKR